VLTLNFIATSDDVSAHGWDTASQGDLLMANGLKYVSGKISGQSNPQEKETVSRTKPKFRLFTKA
jgi:hypothetical protein